MTVLPASQHCRGQAQGRAAIIILPQFIHFALLLHSSIVLLHPSGTRLLYCCINPHRKCFRWPALGLSKCAWVTKGIRQEYS